MPATGVKAEIARTCPDVRYRPEGRRQFLGFVGGAAAWPPTARAQQPERMQRIGVLTRGGTEVQGRIGPFFQELQRLAWTDGRNVRIDKRLGAGKGDATRKYAAELVALAPDVILAVGSLSLVSLLQATSAVPIVFTLLIDPLGGGFVDNLEAVRRKSRQPEQQ